ncbi:MAG: dTMP kinase [Gemmatimonadota bacterium]|jgi:dTMP kinase|nr:dTMP kinase [Gemmatimonadota bacterium]MDQ8147246.1 dTMP kinase [Gemmatimonadota bacterium]MDQ8149230.1 dTMP kinase [Gemmatimonadota bacterium]MDQ8157055.1 dTMP kinase [Gemmatimonadota bacterium]MDQ8176712.1 dTMP kinase [Gemmatimonadota bacterium]
MGGGRGWLVVFEGGEGVGKSTQLALVAERLAAAAVPHRICREPGGTPLGDRVRELLLHADVAVAPAAEAALFAASRAQLVADVLQPALAAGEVVLLDRFLLSTYAYQVGGRGLPEGPVREANRLATDGIVPDLTLVLTLGPSTGPDGGLTRATTRGPADRIERADAGFHARVAEAFRTFTAAAWQATHPECGPIIAIDADGSVATVQARIAERLAAAIPPCRALVGTA